MARRVIIRSRELGTDIAQLEEMLKADYTKIYNKHIQDLELTAKRIQVMAKYLVPVDTGELRASISARVSKSRRYPGLIVTASAKTDNWKPGPHGRKAFDYALIQEENEEYSHIRGMAHYLAGPFVTYVAMLFKQISGGKTLQVSSSLRHAYEYTRNAIYNTQLAIMKRNSERNKK